MFNKEMWIIEYYQMIFLFSKWKSGLTFEVINGDIELRITDPRGSIVHHGDDRSGKHTFGSADPKETYKYCFINEKSTAVVMFSVDVFNEDGAPVATNQTAEEHAIKNMVR